MTEANDVPEAAEAAVGAHQKEAAMWVDACALVRPGVPVPEGNDAYSWVPDTRKHGCDCVPEEVWGHARETALREFGTRDAFQERYFEERRRLDLEARLCFPTLPEYAAPADAAWLRAAQSHPGWAKRDPACPRCHGSGIEICHEGIFGGLSREGLYGCSIGLDYHSAPEDAAPVPCRFCHGTGERADRESARCGWCGGLGQLTPGEREDALAGDSVPVSELLLLFPDGFEVGQIRTPDGRLYVYRRAPWVLASRSPDVVAEESRQQRDEVRELLRRHPDCLVEFAILYST